jgi:hypothetical protein
MDKMKSHATFSFRGTEVEITQEILRAWMSEPPKGHIEVNLFNKEQAEAVFDYLSNELDPKIVSLLEQMGERQFASLFTVYES